MHILGQRYLVLRSLILLASIGSIRAGDLPTPGWRVVQSTPAEQIRAKQPPEAAFDGVKETLWHTRWAEQALPLPHELVIDCGSTSVLTGFSYLPRQDGALNGTVVRYAFAISRDGNAWNRVLQGVFPDSVLSGAQQVVSFPSAWTGRFVRFETLENAGPRPVTSVAELGLFTGRVPRVMSPPGERQWPGLIAVDDRSRLAPSDPTQRIVFVLYTTSPGLLKLSAHFNPMEPEDAAVATLEIERGGQWQPAGEAPIHPVGWTAVFRVPWDDRVEGRYRVRHAGGSVYEGRLRANPVEQDEIVAAVLTCNSPGPGGGRFPKDDVPVSVLARDPDIALFTGDQVYDHFNHTRHWLEFGRVFGAITRDRPTVCLPDDHDIGQPNLWGHGGRAAKVDSEGGYTRPVGYVQMVERQQTSHLPDPVDPSPVEQGIGVYFTSLNIGGIDFAILEDRKFKSGCASLGIMGRKLGPRPDHVDQPGADPTSFDRSELELLGARQERFLESWGRSWSGVVMKAVVSQTAFANLSTHHGGDKAPYLIDFDANGWPQSKRHRAVDLLRRSFALHICGDQHLASAGQYGLEGFGDAGWWFCGPSIANLWPRWWEPAWPPVQGLDPNPSGRPYLGDYLDALGNRITMRAHTNPFKTGREPAELHDRMPGIGFVRFRKSTREMTLECWPRHLPADAGDAAQYPGWPIRIRQLDNNGACEKARYWLPSLEITGSDSPVVEVVDARDGTWVYSVRIQGNRFQPGVPTDGLYRVTVMAGGRVIVRDGLKARDTKDQAPVRIDCAVR